MNTVSLDSLKEQFDRDGYVAIRGFLNAEEMNELTERMDRFIRDIVPTLPRETAYYEEKDRPETLKQIQSLVQHDSWFDELFKSERFTKLAEALLEGPVVRKNLQWFNKPPKIGQATPPHQDGYYFKIEPNEALTMWLALDYVDDENGCLGYIPGSHREGVRDHARTTTLGFSQGITDFGAEDERREVRLHAKPGDLLVHHSLTVHRADANRSDRTRKALGFVYFSSRAKVDVEGIRKYTESLNQDLAKAQKI